MDQDKHSVISLLTIEGNWTVAIVPQNRLN